MKKLLILLSFTILLVSCFTGCAANAPGVPIESPSTVSVEQKVLIETPYVKVSSDTITKDGDQYVLNLAIQNLGTETISISESPVSVNGLTVPTDYSRYGLEPKCNDFINIKLDCSSVFLWGMDKVETIEFTLSLHTAYSHDNIPVSLSVTHEGTNSTFVMDGETILEQDGLTIQYKIVDNWPVCLIVNRSDREMWFDIEDFCINGLTEPYVFFDRKRAEPGESIVVTPDRLDRIYIPETDTVEISFKVKANPDKTLSETVTYEAPFIFDNCGLNEQFYTVYEDEKVCVLLGSHQDTYASAADLCLWIRNNSDEELVLSVSKLTIDGRDIPVYETDTNQEKYYYTEHTVDPQAEEIEAFTSGECGTPEMYGGMKEVYISFNLLLGDSWGIAEDVTISFK